MAVAVPVPADRGSFGLFSAKANGGRVAFFAHVGGFVFGVLITRLLVRAGQSRPRRDTPAVRCKPRKEMGDGERQGHAVTAVVDQIEITG
jgi:hypothetical protein